jgi:hypothetical protein
MVSQPAGMANHAQRGAYPRIPSEIEGTDENHWIWTDFFR